MLCLAITEFKMVVLSKEELKKVKPIFTFKCPWCSNIFKKGVRTTGEKHKAVTSIIECDICKNKLKSDSGY